MTNSDQLAGDLSSIATLVRERMAQSEEAASNIKQAAEAINTAQNNQDYLKGKSHRSNVCIDATGTSEGKHACVLLNGDIW